MGLPVVTVASGGLPVNDQTSGSGRGLAVTETTSGIPVTKVASGGLGVVYVSATGGPIGGLAPAVFVSAGTYFSGASGTPTPSLPSPRTNGNLLLAYCRMSGPGTGTIAVPSGWTLGFSDSQGGTRPTVVAYCYVTGSEAAPAFSGPVQTYAAQVFQYSGAKASSPIGNTASNNSGGATSSMTCPAIVASANNSIAINFANCSGSTTPPTPAGFTNRATTAAAFNVSDMTLVTTGSSTGAVSVSVTTNNYTDSTIEILAA